MNKKNILHQMFIIVHHLKKEFAEMASKYNLTEMEAKFLIHIGYGHEKTSELIKYFEKHKSTIRQKTKSLEEKGYLKTVASLEDRREINLEFTSKGQSFFDKMSLLKKSHYEKVFKDFSKKEIDLLSDLLNKLEINKDHEKYTC